MSADPSPPVDPTVTPKRPAATTVGVVMAWIGGAVLIYAATVLLRVDVSSSIFTNETSNADRLDQIQTYHAAGRLALIWATLLVPAGLFVFVGRRWAGTVLCVMAGFTLYWLVLSLAGGFAPEGITTTVWSISSASLCRLRPATKEWFDAVERVRRLRKQAGRAE